MIANAGIFNTTSNPYSPGADIDVEPSTKEIDVNLKGTLFTARIGQHYLRKTGGGDIILVSSISGFKETPGLAIYLASKHGVIGVLRGLRLTALPEGIRINAICPSVTSMLMPLHAECMKIRTTLTRYRNWHGIRH